MAAKPVFAPNILVNVLASKNADAEPNAAPMDAMAKTEMANGGPFSLEIFQMRYAKKS
jgi:hypothetical protein